jgi:hypothetical protein
LVKTVYVINDDGVIKKTPYKIKMAHFQKMIRFYYVGFPFAKGFGKIAYTEGTLCLPFIIQNLSQCIADIENHLMLSGKQDVYDNENIRRFKRKALISDTIIAQAFLSVPQVLRISLWLAVAGGFVARYYWNFPFQWVMVWCVIGYIFPVAGFLSSQWFMAYRMEHTMKTTDLTVPRLDEFGTYRVFGLAMLLLYLLVGIILKQLVAA